MAEEYISREVAKKALKEAHNPNITHAILSIHAIDNIPAADVRSVVFCKNCKHVAIKDFVYGYCRKNMCGIVQPDDYCSQGERNG